MELELDQGEGNRGQRSGLLKQQGCLTGMSYMCTGFLVFNFSKLFASEYLEFIEKLANILGMSPLECPEKTGPADSGAQAPSPGESVGAMKEQSAWAWVQCQGFGQERYWGSCCVTHIVENPFNVSMQMMSFLYEFRSERVHTQFVSSETSLHLGCVFTMLLRYLAQRITQCKFTERIKSDCLKDEKVSVE